MAQSKAALAAPGWGLELAGTGAGGRAAGVVVIGGALLGFATTAAGQPTCAPFSNPKMLTGDQPNSLAVADLDGDGVADFVTANSVSNDVSIVLGRLDGSFEPERRLPVGRRPRSVAIGDLDGDGLPDLAVANESDRDVIDPAGRRGRGVSS